MAGIGFTLKKLFKEESFSQRTKAYLYSALVAAGPWIAAVLTVNLLVLLAEYLIDGNVQRDLFMGTIVYSFVFSQILTAPWQLIITRYIADKLYTKDYMYIKPSCIGLSKLTTTINILLAVWFYWNKALPFHYKIMAISLFIIISLVWIIMVYLSAVRDYGLIAKAYIFGGGLTLLLGWVFSTYPLNFPAFTAGSNLLFAYLCGITLSFTILSYTFFGNFNFGNHYQFDFLRYLDRLPSLFMIGLFYTLGLWIDDMLMWFSFVGISIYDTYLYAPLYDNAIFLAYLTIIPTMVLFMVSVETEFYETYKNYYSLVNGQGTYRQILIANREMRRSLYRQIAYTFEIQGLLSMTLILLSPQIFHFFGGSVIIRTIFQICATGALFNIFVFIIILVLLYFEAKRKALFVAFLFFFTNMVFTVYFIPFGLDYYGYGFAISSVSTFVIASIIFIRFLRNVDYVTFGRQPLFPVKKQFVFTFIADVANKWADQRLERRRKREKVHNRSSFDS